MCKSFPLVKQAVPKDIKIYTTMKIKHSQNFETLYSRAQREKLALNAYVRKRNVYQVSNLSFYPNHPVPKKNKINPSLVGGSKRRNQLIKPLLALRKSIELIHL